MGFILGYWFKNAGWISDTSYHGKLNKINLMLPLGAAIELPTGYGSVGFGLYANIGLTNVQRRPDGLPGDFNGSRFRAFNIEITNLFASGDQKPKRPGGTTPR